ncbi:MAG: type II CAAX endopeptidase family protein [Candidatus Saccharimonadales bacterium]
MQPKPEPVEYKVTWGPLVAVVVTVIIYFLAQFLGSAIILTVAHIKGLQGEALSAWVEQTGPQFFYIVSVEAMTLLVLWLFLRQRKASFKTLGLTKPKWADLGYVLVGFGMYLPILIAVMAAVKLWFPEVNVDQQQQIGFQQAHGLALVVVFVSLVLLPPITEEILARGFLFLGLRSKLPVIWAALLTSLIFASAHLQFGSGAPLLWVAAIDTFVLSLVLVFLRQKTGRLWSSMGLHMLKNSIAFMALFIFMT